MTIEEYKDAILHQFEATNDCEEFERLIVRSIERMRDKHLCESVISDYPSKFKEILKELALMAFWILKWFIK